MLNGLKVWNMECGVLRAAPSNNTVMDSMGEIVHFTTRAKSSSMQTSAINTRLKSSPGRSVSMGYCKFRTTAIEME